MPRVSLTQKLVESAPLPLSCKSVEHFDQRMPGLVLRVSAGGAKSWNVIYRYQGRARRLTLGRYPVISLDDARARAREVLCGVSRGIDPADKRSRPEALNFGELARMFISGHVNRLRRSRQIARIIERELLSEWDGRTITSITRRDVAVLISSVAQRAPVLANRVLAIARRLFKWAIGQGLIEVNPCDEVERPTRERARERVLAKTELRQLWIAIEELDPSWRALFQLCTLTAQRVGEVLQMRWDDIDEGWWTLPATSAKNGMSHRVPLSPQALQVLSGLPRRGVCVFSAPRAPERPLRAYRKAFKRACAIASVTNACPHDLRRTAASMMTSMGVSRLTVGHILNHSDRSVTAVYDRYSYDPEKRAALELWAVSLKALLPCPTSC